MPKIKINRKKCMGCGTCVDSCPLEMYVIDKDQLKVAKDESECVGCEACAHACPVRAIEILQD